MMMVMACGDAGVNAAMMGRMGVVGMVVMTGLGRGREAGGDKSQRQNGKGGLGGEAVANLTLEHTSVPMIRMIVSRTRNEAS